jgi:hypothetical protein
LRYNVGVARGGERTDWGRGRSHIIYKPGKDEQEKAKKQVGRLSVR